MQLKDIAGLAEEALKRTVEAAELLARIQTELLGAREFGGVLGKESRFYQNVNQASTAAAAIRGKNARVGTDLKSLAALLREPV